MNIFKKLIGPASGLASVSLVLVVSVVALFFTNVGFGWMAKATHADAQGMLVGVNNPGSPVYSYEMYYVFDAEVTVDSESGSEEVFNTYYFKELGDDETAEMALKNYSKLEAPKYHLLLHISVAKDVVGEDIFVDLHVNEPAASGTYGSYGNNTYTIDPAGLADMFKPNATLQPLGLSSALEFYILGKSAGVTWNPAYEKIETDDNGVETTYPATGVFAVRSDKLPEQSTTFMREVNTSNGYVSYKGVSAESDYADGALTVTADSNTLDDVPGFYADEPATVAEGETLSGDGYLDLFVFMTYSAELVNILQNYVAGSTSDTAQFSFRSDVSLLIRKEYN